MGLINIEGIKLYAYHGCLEEEAKIGANYIVNILLDTDFEKAAKSDELIETVDYVAIYDIVKKEMAIRSKLLEHVGKRILDNIKNNFKTVKTAEVTVTKINPPMNGNVEKVSVTLKA